MGSEILLFYLFAAVAVGASLVVVGQKNPMYSVLSLIVSFAALAALYVTLDAPFAAVIQIIIYAGAIMVLFLFVVMLLNAGREDDKTRGVGEGKVSGPGWAGVGLAAVLAGELVWAVAATSGRAAHAGIVRDERATSSLSSVRAIGIAIFTDYSFAFEVTSILILVAMVGAVVLAKRKGNDA